MANSDYRYKINYQGNSKVIKRIVDKLNNLALLGITHDDAFYGDWGNEAYQHSQTTGNPHNLTLEDLGIQYLPRQVQNLITSLGAAYLWGDHADSVVGDHEGNILVFQTSSQLLAWH